MDFKYTVLDKNGSRITSLANAESISVLVTQLKNQGFLPVEIKKIGSASIKRVISLNRKIKFNELVVFTRQLSSMINSGLLLTDALETIRDDVEDSYLGKVLEEVISLIRAGSNFSNALSKFPKVFSNSYVSLIKAGEESGSLDKTLKNLAKYLENLYALSQRIKSAIYYPLFLVFFCIIVVAFIVFFIIPKFETVFAQFSFKLPLITRIVVNISKFSVKNSFILILFPVSLIIAFQFIIRLPKAKLSFDKFQLNIKIVGDIIEKLWVAKFCRTLSILLAGGVGLVPALPISCEVANNTYLKKLVNDVKEKVVAGTSLNEAFKSEDIFPGMFLKMIQVGEKTGKLSDMLMRNAEYYDQEVEARLHVLTAFIEPVLVIFIGGIITVVVIAFYLPIFKISTIIR